MMFFPDEPDTPTPSTTEYTPEVIPESTTPAELPITTVTVEPSHCQTGILKT